MKCSPKLLLVVAATLLSIGILKATLPPVIIGTWSSAVSLSQVRSNAAAVTLSDGRILITGGDGANSPLASAETFATDGTVASVAAMHVARSQHFAVTLSDGRVLAGGGVSGGGGATNSAEIYDPTADSWIQINPMTAARANATAALLQDGRVLIAGGDNSGNPSNTIEIYDPSTGNFNFAGTLSSPRTKHAMAVLSDGRVLIVGGSDGTNPLASSDIFDPSSGNISAGPSLATARYSHSATTLLNGQVAVIGGTGTGTNGGTVDLASIEVFDPSTGAFTTASATLTTARQGHQAYLLPKNNSVLIVGGTSTGTAVAASELFTPQVNSTSGVWTYSVAATGSNVTPRSSATGSAMQQDGLLLAAGGTDASGNALASTELYAFPTVKTDASDYPPGTTVTITGSGFQPLEPVTLTLVELPLIDTHGPYTISADGNGIISDSSFTTDLHDVSVRFWLSAVGSQSGRAAQNTFTDGALKIATDAFAIPLNMCSPPIQVQETNNASVLLTLTTTSGGKFYNDSSCSTQITTITTSASTPSNAIFYYKDSTAGSPTITVTDSLPPHGNTASQTETISASLTATTLTLAPVSPSSVDFQSSASTAVTLSATLKTTTGGTLIPKENVNFFVDGTFVGMANTGQNNQSTGIATFTYNASTLSVGSHTMQALFEGDTSSAPKYAASTSGTQTLTVNKRTTSTSVSCLPNSVNVNSATSCTVSVTDNDSGTTVTPSGTVSFTSSGSGTFSSSGNCTLSGSSAIATCSVSYTPAAFGTGTHAVGGSYGGDTAHATSSGSFNLSVQNPATTTTVTSSSNPSTYGASPRFTATVVPASGSTAPAGTVQFQIDGVSVGSPVSVSPCSPGSDSCAAFTPAAAQLPIAGSPHSITAVYSGDATFLGSTSAPFSQTVNAASTTTALTSSMTPSAFGQAVTFAASVTVNSPGTGGVPSGDTVTFKDGAATLGTGTTNASGVATFSSSSLGVATHSITAVYAGDMNLAGSSSTILSQVVNPASTTTSIAAPTVTYPANATITVTVSSTAGTPTGNVSLTVDGGTPLSQALTNGIATFTLTSPTGGSHGLSASYAAQGNFAASSATAGSLSVGQATPAITFTGAPATAHFNSQFTVSTTTNASTTPTITASGACTISGTLVTMIIGIGTCNLQASWAADTNYVLATATQSTSAQPALVTVTVPNTTVIYDGNPHGVTPTFSAVVSSYSVTYSGISPTVYAASPSAPTEPGSYSVLVTVTDVNYAGSGNATLTISQKDPALALVLRTGMTASSPYGTRVYFELTTANSPCPTGQVQFFLDSDTTPSSTIALSNSPCTGQPVEFSTATLMPGSHTVYAIYGGDTYYLAQTSAPVSHQIDPDATSVTLATSAMTVFVGDSVTLTATVTPTNNIDGSAVAPSGTVQFFDNTTTLLGESTLSSNTAAFTISSLPAGSHSITATYVSANGDFVGNSSPVSMETVDQITPTITWSNPAPIVYGTKLSETQLNATATDSHNGNIPIDGTFTYNPAADTVLAVGPFNLTVTFTPNDTATYATQTASATINITPATLTVTADDATRYYGADNPTFTFKYSGFVNGEDSGIVTTLPACSSTADSKSSVGTYAITCSSGVATNYAIKYVDGSLTVNPATLTASIVGDPTKPYDGNTTATLTSGNFSLSGVVGSDSIMITKTTGTYNSADVASANTVTVALATSDFNAGTGTLLTNYTLPTSASGAGQITKANVTVVFSSTGPFMYNGTPQAPTYAVNGVNSEVLTASATVSYSGTQFDSTAYTNANPPTHGGNYTQTVAFSGNSNYNALSPSATQGFVINKASQTITFGALGNKTYGDPDFAVSATSDSSLTVTFAVGVSDNCTISGVTVHITGAGSCTVTASQAGNNDYNAATQLPHGFSIAKANVTVVFSSTGPFTYNGTPQAPTYAVNGVNSEVLTASATVSYSGTQFDSTAYTNANPPTHGGNYTQTVAFSGNNNYNALSPSATQGFVINKASQTITFAALGNKTYGDPDFAVSATSGSNLSVSFVDSGNCTISGNMVHITGAGSCTVTASQAGNNDYLGATSVSQTFSVAKATPTVSWANPANIIYGTALSSSQLNATFTWVVGGATVNVAGTATYTPGTGTVLNPGAGQPLSVSFTPSDTNDYNTASGSTKISVTFAIGGMCTNGAASHIILPPVNADGSSIFKAGSTVPTKFVVCDVHGNSVGPNTAFGQSASVVASYILASATSGTQAGVDESIYSTTPDQSFRWDPTAQQWIFNQATGKSTNLSAAPATYLLQIKLIDGTIIGQVPAVNGVGAVNIYGGLAGYQFGLK